MQGNATHCFGTVSNALNYVITDMEYSILSIPNSPMALGGNPQKESFLTWKWPESGALQGTKMVHLIASEAVVPILFWS
jgi:hypothetical protein